MPSPDFLSAIWIMYVGLFSYKIKFYYMIEHFIFLQTKKRPSNLTASLNAFLQFISDAFVTFRIATPVTRNFLQRVYLCNTYNCELWCLWLVLILIFLPPETCIHTKHDTNIFILFSHFHNPLLAAVCQDRFFALFDDWTNQWKSISNKKK